MCDLLQLLPKFIRRFLCSDLAGVPPAVPIPAHLEVDVSPDGRLVKTHIGAAPQEPDVKAHMLLSACCVHAACLRAKLHPTSLKGMLGL